MDVIDGLVGIEPGSVLDGMREHRKQARVHGQAAFDALFTPLDAAEMPVDERYAVAAFVTGLHGQAEASSFYMQRVDSRWQAAVTEEIAAGAGAGAGAGAAAGAAAGAGAGAGRGPYGAYPAGPLSSEDVAGAVYRVGAGREALGRRLVAAFEHSHMLVLHPRDAASGALQALLDAGWSTTGIVTLSQLVAFLAYQVRVAAGLRVLAMHPREGAVA